MRDEPEPLWTLKELAAFLSVTEGAARKVISRGQIPSEAVVRVGRRIRLRPGVVRAWVDKLKGA